VKLTGCNPSNPSNEKSFVPIASAINALATKKEEKITNNLVGLSLKNVCIITGLSEKEV
jgi:hypothetical protein